MGKGDMYKLGHICYDGMEYAFEMMMIIFFIHCFK